MVEVPRFRRCPECPPSLLAVVRLLSLPPLPPPPPSLLLLRPQHTQVRLPPPLHWHQDWPAAHDLGACALLIGRARVLERGMHAQVPADSPRRCKAGRDATVARMRPFDPGWCATLVQYCRNSICSAQRRANTRRQHRWMRQTVTRRRRTTSSTLAGAALRRRSASDSVSRKKAAMRRPARFFR
jgi:hypothetical protein